ncbi:MAG: phage tail protein [Burkholderiales bacterium]|nr:phage tail protein [Burkholderiales bacterium]
MSGGKKGAGQIVGYRYYMGLHLALCHGPVDSVNEIIVDRRLAWSGNAASSSRITIAAKQLFGGHKSQGGVAGDVDVCMGEATQIANDYLTAKIGAPQPAYRGVTALVARQLYVAANNPYLKPWWVRVRRAPLSTGWYAAKATIVMPGGVQAANPAHIIVECLTNARWGMGYPLSIIDDAACRAVADALYAEGFGLNLEWSQASDIEKFVTEVCNHIGAAVQQRPDTGLFVIKLLRADYTVGTLPVLDPDSILRLTDYQRASWGETTGEVVLTYTRHDNGEPATIAVQDIANIAAQGGVISRSVNYPGITDAALAARVAQRDLAALSVPLAKVQLHVNRTAWSLMPGDVFQLNWPALGITGLVLRVAGIDTGTLADGTITIDAVEDVFGLGAASYVAPPPSGWVDPVQAPAAATPRLVVEAPYRDVLRRLSAGDFAVLHPTDCYLYALAGKPSAATYSAQISTKAASASAYVNGDEGVFTQTVALVAALPAAAVSTGVAYTGAVDATLWTVGGYALIDNEIVQVTALDTVAGTMTLQRGLFDTVPVAHAAGALVWLADGQQIADRTTWTVGDTVNVQLLTRTGLGVLTSAAAPVDNITLAQRQNRPYAPGNFLVNGAAWPAKVTGPVGVSWAHRDRTVQADTWTLQTAGNIGPETGVTYTVELLDSTGAAFATNAGLTGSSWAWANPDSSHDQLGVRVSAQRGGLNSWQAQLLPSSTPRYGYGLRYGQNYGSV